MGVDRSDDDQCGRGCSSLGMRPDHYGRSSRLGDVRDHRAVPDRRLVRPLWLAPCPSDSSISHHRGSTRAFPDANARSMPGLWGGRLPSRGRGDAWIVGLFGVFMALEWRCEPLHAAKPNRLIGRWSLPIWRLAGALGGSRNIRLHLQEKYELMRHLNKSRPEVA